MTDDDLEPALTLWAGVEGVGLNESDSVPELKMYLARNPGLSLVARDSNAAGTTTTQPLIAAILCGHDGRRGYLHHLAVAPTHRRRGLGNQLIDRCLKSLSEIGIPKCNIFVYANNDAAEHFCAPAAGLPEPISA